MLGCTAKVVPFRTSEEPVPTGVAQRVTATVWREALELLRLETEHETFLTTPEHPFAAPGAGWIRAGQLVPGDWVTSGRFGAVRIVSVRSEPAARPVPVFNLSVASSHAYFVGADRVLVHNTKCGARTLESIDADLEQLRREREALNRELAVLTKTEPGSPRIAALKAQRGKLQRRIDHAAKTRRSLPGVVPTSPAERALQRLEKEQETRQQALADAQRELAELQSREPSSEAEKATFAAHSANLGKRIWELQSSHDKASEILRLRRELLGLERGTPATDADRHALAERTRALRAEITRKRNHAYGWEYERRQRADPGWQEGPFKRKREGKRRRYRPAAYEADTERPRDPLELLEGELADQLQEAPSERNEARIHHLQDQIGTMRRLVEIRKLEHRVRQRKLRTQRTREKWLQERKDTSKLEQKIEQADRELRALRIERVQARVREHLLERLAGTPWTQKPGRMDEQALREFERQLAEGLKSEQQLAGIERALDAMGPMDADWQAAVQTEARDVDEVLSEREQLMGQSPSPERAAELASSYARLEQELREERAAVEGALAALVNEYAHIQTTQAGSSSGPSWQERLRAIQEEQEMLRTQRRTNLQARLEAARQELFVRQNIELFRDETAEIELARAVSLLERELDRHG